MSHPAYNVLTTTWQRLHHFGHLQSLASWDRMAFMPVKGNAARWINHSCDPNCKTFEDEDGRVFIEAKRKIRRGEELAYDYRLQIEGRLTRRERAQYTCRCGAENCRGSMLEEVPPVRS